jgi:hypothetical protein
MKSYEVRIRGLGAASSLAAARWELFVFPEVRDLLPWSGRDRFVVLFEGERPDPSAWCRVLSAAGYPAQPIEPRSGTGDAA